MNEGGRGRKRSRLPGIDSQGVARKSDANGHRSSVPVIDLHVPLPGGHS